MVELKILLIDLNNIQKGSELLFSVSCKNSNLIESKILSYLRSNENYINSKEHGYEYFQCDLDNLKNDISKIINE